MLKWQDQKAARKITLCLEAKVTTLTAIIVPECSISSIAPVAPSPQELQVSGAAPLRPLAYKLSAIDTRFRTLLNFAPKHGVALYNRLANSLPGEACDSARA